MGKREVLRNAREIEKYLEVLLPKLEPSGGIPETPMNRKARGSSRPPISEHVMRLWLSNPHAGRINNILREAAQSTEDVELAGRAMWKVLSDVLFDHTAIRRWKAAGGVEERRFWMLCQLLAQRLAVIYDTPQGPYELRVYIHPTDEPERQKTRTAQKIDTSYTRRLMVRQLEEVEEETGYKGLMAMEILCERKAKEGKDWSVPKLRKARECINRENKERREGAA